MLLFHRKTHWTSKTIINKSKSARFMRLWEIVYFQKHHPRIPTENFVAINIYMCYNLRKRCFVLR